jgi:hypothetical protein
MAADAKIAVIKLIYVRLNASASAESAYTHMCTGPRGKSFFSAGFRELTDTRLGKEEYAAADILCF